MLEEVEVYFTKEELEEFKAIYLQHFNVMLSDEEAQMRARRIFMAIKASIQPVPVRDTIK